MNQGAGKAGRTTPTSHTHTQSQTEIVANKSEEIKQLTTGK